MYAVFDKFNNMIAFHDEKRVVESYVKSILDHSDDDYCLSILKIKKGSEYKIKNKEDLYLVRYGRIFIQSGYVLYMDLMAKEVIEEDRLIIDLIMKRLELSDSLTNKERKILKKSIEIFERIKEDDEKYTPSLQELNQIKWDYNPYIYNKYLMDDPYLHY